MEKTENKPFEIALVLAGAVACGSYLAGVLDYLLDLLDSWEEAKTSGVQDVPRHSIRIRVVAGASAGGMSAAIFIREAFRRARIRREGRKPDSKDSLLRKAWVESVDIDQLLESRDLKKGHPIPSLLDCSVIDRVAKEILCEGDGYPVWEDIPYFGEELKVFLTITNLRGLTYELKFTSETKAGHRITNHGDYQDFLFKPTDDKENWNMEWEKLKETAISTGAFPIALKPRFIEDRTFSFYHNRLKGEGRGLDEYLEISESQLDTKIPFHVVDGGTINNEPFELARSIWSLLDEEGKFKQGELKQGQNCVIMIDPFPGELPKETVNAERSFYSYIPDLIGTLLDQSRFRLEELVEWGKGEEGTRFLIMPRNKDKNGTIKENPLQGGFLGGFGGFFDQKLREHDYDLGRKNSESFFNKYFVLPGEIAEKEGAFKGITLTSIKYEDSNKSKNVIQIIPNYLNSDSKGDSQYSYPDERKISKERFNQICKEMRSRLENVFKAFGVPGNWLLLLPMIYFGIRLFGITGSNAILVVIADLFFSVFFVASASIIFLKWTTFKFLKRKLKEYMNDWGVLNFK